MQSKGLTAADAQLRASYSGTPGRLPAAGGTPDLRRSVTPARTAVPGRAAAGEPRIVAAAGIGSLTDDLLKI